MVIYIDSVSSKFTFASLDSSLINLNILLSQIDWLCHMAYALKVSHYSGICNFYIVLFMNYYHSIEKKP